METRPAEILAVAIIFLLTSWIAVSLRVYVRLRMLKAFGADDYTVLAALISFTGYVICQFGGLRHGTGRQRSELTDHDAQIALNYWFLCEVFYAPSTTFLKVSVGLLLLRVTVEKIQVWLIRILIAGSIIFGAFWFFLIIFQCKPVSFWWDLNPTHTGTCISPLAFSICGYIVSVLNSIADFTFAVLPMIIVWKTTMNARTKAVVCTLLGFGSLACFATIVRMPYIHTMNNYKGNFLYNTTEVALWSTIEIGIGITASCLATLRPMFQHWLQHSSSGTQKQVTLKEWKSPGLTGGKSMNRTGNGSPRDQDLEFITTANAGGVMTTITAGKSGSFDGGLGLVMLQTTEVDRSETTSIEEDAAGTRKSNEDETTLV